MKSLKFAMHKKEYISKGYQLNHLVKKSETKFSGHNKLMKTVTCFCFFNPSHSLKSRWLFLANRFSLHPLVLT